MKSRWTRWLPLSTPREYLPGRAATHQRRELHPAQVTGRLAPLFLDFHSYPQRRHLHSMRSLVACFAVTVVAVVSPIGGTVRDHTTVSSAGHA